MQKREPNKLLPFLAFEIRNPKAETRKKAEVRRPKSEIRAAVLAPSPPLDGGEGWGGAFFRMQKDFRNLPGLNAAPTL